MVEARLQEPAQRIDPDRTDVDPLVRQSGERAVEPRRRIRAILDAPGEQEQDGVANKTPDGESDSLRRRRVEPLDVVDSDHDRAFGG